MRVTNHSIACYNHAQSTFFFMQMGNETYSLTSGSRDENNDYQYSMYLFSACFHPEWHFSKENRACKDTESQAQSPLASFAHTRQDRIHRNKCIARSKKRRCVSPFGTTVLIRVGPCVAVVCERGSTKGSSTTIVSKEAPSTVSN